MKSRQNSGGALGLIARGIFVSVLAAVLALAAFAQPNEEPRSFSLSDKSESLVDRKVMPKVDVGRLLAQDREQKAKHIGPHRFAVAVDGGFTAENSGTWQNLPDGRLWRLRIQSPGAITQNLGITRFDLSEGTKLWLYDPKHTVVQGPYTLKNRSRIGSFWTPVVQGDEIVIEIFVPTGAAQSSLQIGKVNQGYQGFEKAVPGAGTEGTCENDVVCPLGNSWRDQIRAVGVYTLNGTGDCTGTMMNNTAHDFRAFFLSANHCGVNTTNDTTVVVYWNYQAATCGTHGPGNTTQNQSGSTFRASFATSDFQLIELSAVPNPAFNVFYAGWDATGNSPPSTVGIHHPSGDVKAISTSNTAAIATNPAADLSSDTASATGSHWRVDWSSGVTEKGSSGRAFSIRQTIVASGSCMADRRLAVQLPRICTTTMEG